MMERYIYGWRWKLTKVWVYIGSTFNLISREWQHRNCSQPVPFDKFMKYHGVDAFEWVLLETVTGTDRFDAEKKSVFRENWWMDEKRTWHEFGKGGMNFIRANVQWSDAEYYKASCAALSEALRRSWEDGNRREKQAETWAKSKLAVFMASRKEEIIHRYKALEGCESLGEWLGQTPGLVLQYLRRWKVSIRTQSEAQKIAIAKGLSTASRPDIEEFLEGHKAEILRLNKEGATLTVLTEKYGVSQEAITTRLDKWKVKRRTHKEAAWAAGLGGKMNLRKNEIILLFKSNSPEEIAVLIGVSTGRVRKSLDEWGIPRRTISETKKMQLSRKDSKTRDQLAAACSEGGKVSRCLLYNINYGKPCICGHHFEALVAA